MRLSVYIEALDGRPIASYHSGTFEVRPGLEVTAVSHPDGIRCRAKIEEDLAPVASRKAGDDASE